MVQGLSSLRRKLTKAIPAAARRRAIIALEKSADEIVALMKRLAPKDEGSLADSIGWTWGAIPKGAIALTQSEPIGKDRLRITIYAGSEKTITKNARGIEFQNAFLQEFGTQDMPANPYFFPSWRALRKRASSRIKREITKGVKEGTA